jgi:predicted nucleic acid-binding protein
MPLVGERVSDSDVLINHLRGYRGYKGYIARYEIGELRGYVSVITVAELFAVKRARNSSERNKVERLLSLFTIVPVDFSIARLAEELHRDYGLSLPDALVTRNIRHYRRVPNPRLEVPYR